MPVRPIPDGFHTITPYLVLDGAGQVIEFLKKAFGAEEVYRHKRPDGGVAHAQVKIRDSMLMLSDATKEHPAAPCMLYMYVEDVDAWYERAIKAGGISIMKPTDMYYGDRNAGVKDASGMQWWIGTRKEDLAAEEVEKRAAAAGKATSTASVGSSAKQPPAAKPGPAAKQQPAQNPGHAPRQQH